MNPYRLGAQILAFILLFIALPIMAIAPEAIEKILTLPFFVLMFLSFLLAKMAGKKNYDERELRIVSKSNTTTMVLSFGYTILIALLAKRMDLGMFLPVAIISIMLFQITVSNIMFQWLKATPHAEGKG